MKLFTMESHIVQINPELRLIPEFRRIIERDKDRTKKTALAELAFVYYTTDHMSPYADMSEKEQLNQAKKDLKLIDWKPDEDIRLAINKYKLLQDTPATKTLRSVKQGLLVSTDAINALTSRIELLLSQPSADEKEAAASIDLVMKNVKSLMDLSDKLPDLIGSITKLEEQVKKEQSGDTKLRGGGTKGSYED